MRTRVGVPHDRAAPRYQTVASEAHAARLAAHEERRADAARAEAAKFFYDLRRGLRLARVAVADRIGTEPAVVEALETGRLDALPAWPETRRIVTNYAHLVGMDPRPVLHALYVAVSQHQRKRASESWLQRLERKVSARLSSDDRHHRRSQTLTWAAGIGAPAVLAGSLMLTSGLQASQLPQPLASMFGFEQKTRAEAIRRLEGMVWIDAVDPRQRRGDKLPGTTR